MKRWACRSCRGWVDFHEFACPKQRPFAREPFTPSDAQGQYRTTAHAFGRLRRRVLVLTELAYVRPARAVLIPILDALARVIRRLS